MEVLVLRRHNSLGALYNGSMWPEGVAGQDDLGFLG